MKPEEKIEYIVRYSFKDLINVFNSEAKSQEELDANIDGRVSLVMGLMDKYHQIQVSKTDLPESGVDDKIATLLELTEEFIFPAYYSHEGKVMWKISNVYTKYRESTLVLCPLEDGILKALDLAIESIGKAKNEFYGE